MSDFTYCPLCQHPLLPQEHGGKTRKACPEETCNFVQWDNPIPVVAALVEHEDHVILVRNHGWPETWYGLVSGFLEREESPQEGILREIEEELGLTGEIVSLIGNYAFPLMNQVILAYHVRAHGTIQPGDELAGFKIVAPDKLRPWPMGTGEAVRDWLAARTPSTQESTTSPL